MEIDKSFRNWLQKNTSYKITYINDVISRLNRVDKILKFTNSDNYYRNLEDNDTFKSLNSSVKSQIRKSLQLYSQYLETITT